MAFDNILSRRGRLQGKKGPPPSFEYSNIVGVNYVDSPYAMQPNQSPYAKNMDFGYPSIGSMSGVRGHELLFTSLGAGKVQGLHCFKHSDGDYLLAAWDKYLYVLTGDTGVVSKTSKADWDAGTLIDVDTATSVGDMKLEAGAFSDVATLTADFDGTHSGTAASGDKVQLSSTSVVEATICRTGASYSAHFNSSSTSKVGQTFVMGASTTNISRVDMNVVAEADHASVSGTITVKIWDTPAKGNLIGSEAFAYTGGARNNYNFTFTEPIEVSPSTGYYLEFVASAGAAAGLARTSSSYYSGGCAYYNEIAQTNYDLVGYIYSSTPVTGTYTHGILNPSSEGENKDIYITYRHTTTTGTFVDVEYRLSSDGGNNWSDWAAATTGEVLIPAGTSKSGYRIQWRCRLKTNIGGSNASLDDVSVLATNAAYGSWESPAYDFTNAPATANLTFDQTVPEGCTVTWYARASNNNTVFGDWQEVFTSGDSIPLGRYVQLKSYLASPPPYTATPTINGLVVAYSSSYTKARRLGIDPLERADNLLTGNRVRFCNYGDWCIMADGLRSFILYVEDGSQESGIVQAAGPSNITLKTEASAADDWYNNALITITGGTGAGQVRWISDYAGSTKVATVSEAWTTQPDVTSTYTIGSAFKVRNTGVDAPTVAASGVDSGVAGSPNGAYLLKYTYVNKDGIESNSSPASASMSVSSKKITWTVPVDTTAYNRTASRRLYRTAAGGAVYKYVGEIADNSTNSFTDNISDVGLGSLMLDNNNVPPLACSMVAEFSSYVFYIDNYDAWFSKAGNPDAVPNIVGDIQQMSFPGRVLDFKAHPMALMIGGEDFNATITSNTGFIIDSDPTIDTTTTRVIDKYGSLSAEGSAMCLSPDLRSTLIIPTLTGIRATIPGLQDNSIESVPLSKNIQPFYDLSINRDQSAAVFYNSYYIYSMEYQSDTEAEPEHITFAYDLRTSQWYGPWEFGMSCYAIVDNVLYAGDTENGKIYRMFTGNSFAGNNIDKVCDLPMRAPGGEQGNCKFTTLTAIVDSDSNTSATYLSPKVDNWEKRITLGNLPNGFTGAKRPGHDFIRTRKHKISRSGHTCSVRIEDDSTNPLIIHKLITEYEVLTLNR